LSAQQLTGVNRIPTDWLFLGGGGRVPAFQPRPV